MKAPCYQHDSYDSHCSSCVEMNQPTTRKVKVEAPAPTPDMIAEKLAAEARDKDYIGNAGRGEAPAAQAESEVIRPPFQKELTVIMLPNGERKQAEEDVKAIQEGSTVLRFGPLSTYFHALRLAVANDASVAEKIAVFWRDENQVLQPIGLTEEDELTWPIGFENELLDIEVEIQKSRGVLKRALERTSHPSPAQSREIEAKLAEIDALRVGEAKPVAPAPPKPSEPQPDPSPTPWDFSTWGFYCDTCRSFFELLKDGRVVDEGNGYHSYEHKCGNPARYIGYDHSKTTPPKPVRSLEDEARELEKYLCHLPSCGSGSSIADSLAGDRWEDTKHKWRDCTCGLARHAREKGLL